MIQEEKYYEDIAKAFQLGLAFGFGEKHDEMDKVISEIKKVIKPQESDDLPIVHSTYQEELNDIRQDLLRRSDQYITFRDLVRRFDEVDLDFNHSPLNLLQIYSNLNVLIGEESNK